MLTSGRRAQNPLKPLEFAGFKSCPKFPGMFKYSMKALVATSTHKLSYYFGLEQGRLRYQLV